MRIRCTRLNQRIAKRQHTSANWDRPTAENYPFYDIYRGIAAVTIRALFGYSRKYSSKR